MKRMLAALVIALAVMAQVAGARAECHAARPSVVGRKHLFLPPSPLPASPPALASALNPDGSASPSRLTRAAGGRRGGGQNPPPRLGRQTRPAAGSEGGRLGGGSGGRDGAGGGSAARPSAASSRRTGGSVTAPRIRHGPAQRADEHVNREHPAQQRRPGQPTRRAAVFGVPLILGRARYDGRSPAGAGSRSILPRERRRSPFTTAGTLCTAKSPASDARSRGGPARCSFASCRTGRRAPCPRG
jgi:hypothetical protein